MGTMARGADPTPPEIAHHTAPAEHDQAIAQWRARRVGLFIHWGPSSGRALPQSHSHARQSALNPHGSVPAGVYDQFYREFNPTGYDPDAWLKLAYDAGMRYTVFVAKHHDGFCMFDSAATGYDIMATPYGQDVAAMFADACRRQGLALGWQISPKDWKHPYHCRAGAADFRNERNTGVVQSSTCFRSFRESFHDGRRTPERTRRAAEAATTNLFSGQTPCRARLLSGGHHRG